jgi:YD repeat-containing protein
VSSHLITTNGGFFGGTEDLHDCIRISAPFEMAIWQISTRCPAGDLNAPWVVTAEIPVPLYQDGTSTGEGTISLTSGGDPYLEGGAVFYDCNAPPYAVGDRKNDPCQGGQSTTGGTGGTQGGRQSQDRNQNVTKQDPVNLGNGGTFFEHPDLQPVRLPGETLSAALAFGRYQSTGNPTLDPFRGGWTHNYNVRLEDLTTQVLITDWQGSRYTFTLGDNGYDGDGTSTLTTNGNNFVWQLRHGTRYVFDAANSDRLSNITDRVGSFVNLRYNTSNLLTGVVDSAGRRLAFAYNASNQLTNLVDPIARTNIFTYDGQGRLASVADGLGTKAQYVYGDGAFPNAITRLINARGHTNSFAYNSLGQAVAETNTVGKVQTFSWTGTNQSVTVTQFGGTTYTIYNNADGAVTARVDAAGTTTYTRDSQQRATQMTDRLGNVTQYFYNTNGCACGISGTLAMQIDPLGRTNAWTYESSFNFPVTFTNAAGGVTRWTYDSKGNVTTNTDAAGQITRYGYDAAGNRTSITDANNRTTTFGYDAYGNRTNTTDALGNKTSATYDLVGMLDTRTDALGRTELFAWDDRDRLIGHVNAAVETNSWEYDGNGNMTAWMDPLGFERTYAHDALDRLASITLPAGGGAFLSFGYDALGNRTNVTDALGNKTAFGYDALSRLVSITNALGKGWVFTVDAEGRRAKATDPNGHINGFVYDAVGQVTGWTNANSQVTVFAYDKLGNLTTLTDPRTNSLTFGYDAVSRLTNATYAGVSGETFRYDGVGNLTNFVNRAGQTVRLTYDDADRLTQKEYVGINDVIAFAYDAANQLTGVVWAAGTATNSALSFRYDAAGRLTNETQVVGQAASLAVGYQYYADGRRKRLTYPDGTFITYTYNSNGWLTGIYDGGTDRGKGGKGSTQNFPELGFEVASGTSFFFFRPAHPTQVA